MVVTPVLAPIASVARKIQRKFGMRSASWTSRSGSSRLSFRFVGDEARYAVRSHTLSPPFPEMGVTASHGDAMPEQWFPVVWRA